MQTAGRLQKQEFRILLHLANLTWPDEAKDFITTVGTEAGSGSHCRFEILAVGLGVH